ncbi:MAG: hypothetical protein DRJ49_01310 [Thermoprotei archaeon]|nr:MAG: hypothetical protein DRJ49_01310 [Thermoprotei archaeon]
MVRVPRSKIPIELYVDRELLYKIFPHSLSNESSVVEYRAKTFDMQREHYIVFNEDDFSGYFRLIESRFSGVSIQTTTVISPFREMILTKDFSAPLVLLGNIQFNLRHFNHSRVVLKVEHEGIPIEIVLESEKAVLEGEIYFPNYYSMRIVCRRVDGMTEIRWNPVQDIPLKKGCTVRFGGTFSVTLNRGH